MKNAMATGSDEVHLLPWILGGVNVAFGAVLAKLIPWAVGVHSDIGILKSQMTDIRTDVKDMKLILNDIHRNIPKRESD